MRTHTKETQETTTPQAALQFLREGNYRFVSNLKANRNLLQQVNETRDGQFPFATVLSCIDSRTSAELIVEQSVVLREMIEKEEIALIGAVYDVETGTVEFLEETLMLGEIKHFYLDV